MWEFLTDVARQVSTAVAVGGVLWAIAVIRQWLARIR